MNAGSFLELLRENDARFVFRKAGKKVLMEKVSDVECVEEIVYGN